ncbi:MAG: ribonuclease HIII [Firmicutes bacterium]|nr:ribonuclease HIII [Bacillota bacterium]
MKNKEYFGIIISRCKMTIVFKVSDNLKNKIIDYYKDLRKEKTPPYAVFQAQEADTTITLYESGKIMFQGTSADIDANIWIDLEKKLNNRIINIDGTEKKVEKKETNNLDFSTIGSDEVGTGDFFGPIVVTATFVSTKDFEFLQNLGVRDSKKIDDAKILQIAPEIMKQIPYVTTILDNKTYNERHSKNLNMNKLKAILHNKALYELKNKNNWSFAKIVVDEFCSKEKFYEYIQDVPEKVMHITFMTKAEDKVFSVACASIISRYIFLRKMDELSDSVHIPLPKGAGANVDKVAKEIVDEFGHDKLYEIAKMNFSNASRL